MTSRLDWSVSYAMGEQISLNSALRTEPFNRPLLLTPHQYFICSIYIHHGTCSVRPAVPLCFYLFILFIYFLPPSWYTDKLQLFPTIRATLKQSWMKDAFRPQQAAVIQSDRQKWAAIGVKWDALNLSLYLLKTAARLDGDNHQDLLFLPFCSSVSLGIFYCRHFILFGY